MAYSNTAHRSEYSNWNICTNASNKRNWGEGVNQRLKKKLANVSRVAHLMRSRPQMFPEKERGFRENTQTHTHICTLHHKTDQGINQQLHLLALAWWVRDGVAITHSREFKILWTTCAMCGAYAVVCAEFISRCERSKLSLHHMPLYKNPTTQFQRRYVFATPHRFHHWPSSKVSQNICSCVCVCLCLILYHHFRAPFVWKMQICLRHTSKCQNKNAE